MSIFAVCPDCSKEYKVPDDRAGTKIRCKACKGVIQIEELEESPLLQDQKQKGPKEAEAGRQEIPKIQAEPDTSGVSAGWRGRAVGHRSGSCTATRVPGNLGTNPIDQRDRVLSGGLAGHYVDRRELLAGHADAVLPACHPGLDLHASG